MIKHLPKNRSYTLVLFSLLFLYVTIAFLVFSSVTNISYAQLNGCGDINVGNPTANVTVPPQCISAGSGVNAGVIAMVKTQLGKPYGWGAPPRNWPGLPHPVPPATEPAPSSYDCSGLAGWAYYWGTNKKVNLGGDTYVIWDDTSSMYQRHIVIGASNLKPGELQNGDLVFWGTEQAGPHHVGIYVDEAHKATSAELALNPNANCQQGDCFIDAPDTGSFVRWDSIKGFGNDFLGYIHVVQ